MGKKVKKTIETLVLSNYSSTTKKTSSKKLISIPGYRYRTLLLCLQEYLFFCLRYGCGILFKSNTDQEFYTVKYCCTVQRWIFVYSGRSVSPD
jgi:hypothetical protein